MTPSSRILALGLTLVISSAGLAAGIPKPPDANKYRADVAKMRSGSIRVKDPDDKSRWEYNQKALDTVAKWLVYMIATPPINGEPVPRDEKNFSGIRTVNDLIREVEFFTSLQPPASNMGKLLVEQTEFGAAFGKALAQAAKVVLDNSARPIERVNTVRILSIAARMPSPDLGDAFVEIINNAKISDAEKIYAFEGVQSLMEQTDIVDPNKHVIHDANHLAKIAMSLSNYITQDRAPRDDREKAVIEFVRRHAVAALASFRDGVFRKPNHDLIFRPSWTLMRIIGGDSTVSPPFSIQEKTEAIVGFCQMKNDPDMNLDVATYMIAVAPLPRANGTELGGLVEFARAANEDGLRATRENTLPLMAWKVAAARISLALANWRQLAKTLPKSRYPELVVDFTTRAAIPLLALIEKDGVKASTGGEVQTVTTWATDNAPKAWRENPPQAAQLYKDDPKSVLPFAAPAKKNPAPKLATPPAKDPVPKTVSPKKK